MATLRDCSVADVTLRLKAHTGQIGEQYVYYDGPFGDGYDGYVMMFLMWTDGLRYFRYLPGAPDFWGNILYYEGGIPGNAAGPSTLVKAFDGGSLDCVLRFRLVADEEDGGNSYGECYCDDVLADTWPVMTLVRGFNVGDLIADLNFVLSGGSVSGAGEESGRIGSPAATVWGLDTESVWNEFEGDYDNGVTQVVTEYSPVRTAEEGFGGTPQVVLSASRQWAEWAPYIKAGGDAAEYRRSHDLMGDGTITGWARVNADEDGCLYLLSEAGDTDMDLVQIVFDRYCPLLGMPNLSIGHHAVADTLLVTDAGLSGGTVGWWKVQNK